MARVTVTNLQSRPFMVPSPIQTLIPPGRTRIFDGISPVDMENSIPFVSAINNGLITVSVGNDPNVPDSIETSSVSMSGGVDNIVVENFLDLLPPWDQAIMDSVESPTTDITYSLVDFNGPFVVAGEMPFSPPRILSIEAIDFDDQPVVEIVVRGYVEVRGVRYQLEETVELDLWVGSGWARTRNPFSYVSEIDVPAQSDADGNINVGINHRFGINGLPTPLVEGFGHAPLLMDFGVDVGNNNWYSYSGSLRLAPNAPVWVISPDDYNYTDDLEFSRWSYQLSYVGSRS